MNKELEFGFREGAAVLLILTQPAEDWVVIANFAEVLFFEEQAADMSGLYKGSDSFIAEQCSILTITLCQRVLVTVLSCEEPMQRFMEFVHIDVARPRFICRRFTGRPIVSMV